MKTDTNKNVKPLKIFIVTMLCLYVAFTILASLSKVNVGVSLFIAASLGAVLNGVFIYTVLTIRKNIIKQKLKNGLYVFLTKSQVKKLKGIVN